jgi:hypothetical protein
MKDIEKLQKLFKIAIKNGYKTQDRIIDYFVSEKSKRELITTYYIFNTWFNFKIDCFRIDSCSINEIILYDSSFIDALCKSKKPKNSDEEIFDKLFAGDTTVVYSEGMNNSQLIMTSWLFERHFVDGKYVHYTRPPEKRLEWLFHIFSHLLE